jgi:hypothetical protein
MSDPLLEEEEALSLVSDDSCQLDLSKEMTTNDDYSKEDQRYWEELTPK